MIEKLVSLIRFSFSENPIVAIASKIRHFYDLYFLTNDAQCAEYIQSADFKTDFAEIYVHDQKTFEEPGSWRETNFVQSPLVTDFETMWDKLKDPYRIELTQLAFTKIPSEKEVAKTFIYIVTKLK